MHKLKAFTLIELIVVMAIIGILTTIGINSFSSSRMRARDVKRKTQLKQLADALESYYNDKGQYPLSDGNGHLMGCGANATELCSWGDAFSNTTTGTVYMVQLPQDSSADRQFYYRSNSGSDFQIYALLENTKDPDIPTAGSYAGTDCGNGVECNYGVASPNATP